MMVLSKKLAPYLVVCGVVFSSFSVNACIWLSGTNINGESKTYDGGSNIYELKSVIDEQPKDRLETLREPISDQEENKFNQKEYQGVKSLLKGDYNDSIKIFLEIEKQFPKIYSTASNLGTAYELAGENEKALSWILEGIKRNQNSHDGTEWLHVLILKNKIKLEQDQNFLTDQRVIELPENFTDSSVVEIDNSKYDIKNIQTSIMYQLRERLLFVKPTDPIVADLFYTLGLIEAHTNVIETALEFLELSEQYGFSNPQLLKATQTKYQSLIDARTKKENIDSWLHSFIILLICLIIILFLYIIIKVNKRKRT